MKQLILKLVAGCLLGNLVLVSSALAEGCSPDMTSVTRLEVLAKQKGSLGATAKSALLYLARENLPATGYYMAKAASSAGKGKLAFLLFHESGFRKPCVIGNQSGMDGVLVVDATTHEVERLVSTQ